MRHANEVFLAVRDVFTPLRDSKVEFIGTDTRASAQGRKSDI
jgi:hypothetical protein